MAFSSRSAGQVGDAIVVEGDVTPSDDFPNPTNAVPAASFGMLWDGAAWDRARSGFVGIQASAVGWQNSLPMGQYLAAPPALANGEFRNLLTDIVGSLHVRMPALETGNGVDDMLPSVGLRCVSTGYASDGVDWDRVRAGIVGIVASVVGHQNVLPVGQYLAAPPALANGEFRNLVTDIVGSLNVRMPALEISVGADGQASSVAFSTADFNYGYNGATWDRMRVSLTGVQASAVGFENHLPMVQFRSAPAALADAEFRNLLSDERGSARVTQGIAVSATNTPSRFVDFGANATANVKASAGNVYSLSCHNRNLGLDRYIQLHDTAGTPAGGAVPIVSFYVPMATQVLIGSDFFQAMGLHFPTGIAFAFSTTEGTYTAAAAGDQATQVFFV